MELYIYESPDGNIGDFRPYLDGVDHSFDEPKPLGTDDARHEKIEALFHPTTGRSVAGKLRYVGRSEVQWSELMRFPVAWDGGFEPIG